MGTHILRGSTGRSLAGTRIDRRGRDHGTEARVAKLEATTEHIQRDLTDLKTEVRELRSDLKTEVAGLRSELKAEVSCLRSEARADFRLLFGAILTVAVGLASLMAKSFGWL